MFVMNSAPREDYVEDEDEIMTPEIWRDLESKYGVRGEREILTYVARHKPSGKFAGFTTVAFKRLQPDLVEQWDTGVDPAHRNKGIGRWVKAAMAFELRDRYPTVRRIDTENAGFKRADAQHQRRDGLQADPDSERLAGGPGHHSPDHLGLDVRRQPSSQPCGASAVSCSPSTRAT